MAKSNNNKVLFTVNGFDVLDNTVYRVRQKKDPRAPEEMQAKGYSKYPGAGNTIKCPFNVSGDVYETGFEPSSRMYITMDETEKKVEVKKRRENVLIPYLNSRGLDETRFRPSSFEDWDNVKVELSEDKVFNTADIKDRFELYICLIKNSIVPPEGNEFDYKYNEASFVLESSKIKTKTETENRLKKVKATSLFNDLLKNPIDCIDVLVYTGYSELSSGLADEEVLLMYLDNKILNTTRNTEIFIETAEKFYNSDNDKNEIKLHRIITHALVSKNKDFARDGLEILFKNEPLGDNEKEAAKFLVENVNKQDVLLQILSKYDNKKTK